MIAFSLAFVLGTIAAYHIGRPVDRGVTALAVVGVSVPNYWLGIVLVIIFAVKLGVLPATGMGPQGSTSFNICSTGASFATRCCRRSLWRWCRWA